MCEWHGATTTKSRKSKSEIFHNFQLNFSIRKSYRSYRAWFLCFARVEKNLSDASDRKMFVSSSFTSRFLDAFRFYHPFYLAWPRTSTQHRRQSVCNKRKSGQCGKSQMGASNVCNCWQLLCVSKLH